MLTVVFQGGAFNHSSKTGSEAGGVG